MPQTPRRSRLKRNSGDEVLGLVDKRSVSLSKCPAHLPKEKRHDFGTVDIDVHLGACRLKPYRHRFRGPWHGPCTRLEGWTALFLATTVLTSVTGFFFPSTGFGPAHAVGILSLVVLAAAIVALYFFHLAGPWRWIYTVGAVLALYLNVFVAVVQAFQKLPPLAALAPTQSEPPFLIAELVMMAIFIVLGVVAVKRFHGIPSRPTWTRLHSTHR